MNNLKIIEKIENIVNNYDSAYNYLKLRLRPEFQPNLQFMVIAGSGMSNIIPEDNIKNIIKYSDIPDFPKSAVSGHKNELIICEIHGRLGMVFSGRFHPYEGMNISEIVASVIVAYKFGVKNAILTNAAGGLNADKMSVGTLMIVKDILNFTKNILLVKDSYNINRIIFDDKISDDLLTVLKKSKINVASGTYVCMQGSCYETHSEAKMLKSLGIDAAGMSTFHEAQVASLLGMQVIGISIISNMLLGYEDISVNHNQVLEAIKIAENSIYTAIIEAIKLF